MRNSPNPIFILSVFAALCPVSGEIIATIDGFDAVYPAGKYGGATNPAPAHFIPIPPAKDYYLDYQVYFEDDWEWVKGGKLPGLAGGSRTTGCRDIEPDGWSARFMWRADGGGQLYLYHQDRRNTCGDATDFPDADGFGKNRWNRMTQRTVINTPALRRAKAVGSLGAGGYAYVFETTEESAGLLDVQGRKIRIPAGFSVPRPAAEKP